VPPENGRVDYSDKSILKGSRSGIIPDVIVRTLGALTSMLSVVF